MGPRQVAWLGLASVLGSGCILDDDRCGANQVETTELFEGCLCGPNAAPNADGVGCHLCGANEEVKAGGCVCSAGFSRPSSMAPCTMTVDSGAEDSGPSGGVSTGQGKLCTSSADCEGVDATYCVLLQSPPSCAVDNCATGVNRCDSTHVCCEFRLPPALVLTNGLCVPTGMCPSNVGMVVTP